MHAELRRQHAPPEVFGIRAADAPVRRLDKSMDRTGDPERHRVACGASIHYDALCIAVCLLPLMPIKR